MKMIMLLVVAAGMSAAAFADASYSAAYIETDDPSVRRIDLGTEYVYVFTNATLGNVDVTFRRMLTFNRCLMVGGGGAGGWTLGGGGGAGGVVDLNVNAVVMAGEQVSLSVGAGGLPDRTRDGYSFGNPGGNTIAVCEFFSVTAYGGAGGRGWTGYNWPFVGTYGSGGGCAANSRNSIANGTRLQGYVTTADGLTFNGYEGGKSFNFKNETGNQYAQAGGGGGGAGGAGGDCTAEHAGHGGLGVTNDITGLDVEYAAGGGGGAGNGIRDPGMAGGVSAGAGGKWNGNGGPTAGDPAPDGFGGGGGGGGYSGQKPGGKGGAGTVILRVSTVVDGTYTLSAGSVGSGTVTVDGNAPDPTFHYEVGTNLTLVATPAAGWRFAYWTGDLRLITSGSKTTATVTVSMVTGASLVAHFVPEDATSVAVADGRLQLTIDVESGETAADDWLAAQNPAIDDCTAFDDIIKTGAGTLVVSNAVFDAFPGDFLIRAGRVKTSVTDPLGAINPLAKVVVSSNATLHVRIPTAAAVPFGDKPVYFAGDGTDGKGALWEEQAEAGKNSCLPTHMYLTGDAKTGLARRTNIADNRNYHLEGHVLTTGGAGGYDTWNPRVYDSTGNGRVYINAAVLFVSDPFTFGTAANTLTIKGDTYYRPYWAYVAHPWTMILESGAWLQPTASNSWAGPVVLESGAHRFTRQSGYNWPTLILSGKVSGPGGFGNSNNGSETTLSLTGTENTFEGGVYLKVNSLHLGGNGSLPAAGGALTCVNGSVKFLSSTDDYDLPPATFSGTGVVNCAAAAWARGAWRTGVSKEEAGELTYAACVGAPLLDVKGGGICFPVTDAAAELPDFTNVCVRSGAYVRFGDGWAGTWAVTNLTGAGTVSNGNVRVAGAFAVSDEIASGGYLDVHAGTLTFGEGAQVRVAGTVDALVRTAALQRGTVYTLAEADAISGVPRRTDEKGWFAFVADGEGGRKLLQVQYIAGTQVIFR